MENHGKLIVLTGPSASGKTTIAADLIRADSRLVRLVTCTTRSPRPDETPDIDYHFLDRAEFEEGVKRGEFFEWANVYEEMYGSRKSDVQKTVNDGRYAVVVMDVQGASTVKSMMPNAIIVFVKSPIEEMRRRMMKRVGFSESEVKRRTKELERELMFSAVADHVVENRDGHLAEAILDIRHFLRSHMNGR